MNESSSQSPSPGISEPPAHKRVFHFWRCFWLTFLAVSLAYAWYSFYVPVNSIAWADNYTSAQQQAAESGKPIILYFTGEWCVPCRVMKRQVWADEEVKTSVNAHSSPWQLTCITRTMLLYWPVTTSAGLPSQSLPIHKEMLYDGE